MRHERTTVVALRRAACAATAVALSVAMLTACSSENNREDGQDGALVEVLDTLPAATGGVEKLTWALPFGEPTDLDPIQLADTSKLTVGSNVCDNLLEHKVDRTVGPSLASEWSYSEDRKSLTFELRTDVKFSNGNSMTAEDVQFSLARHLDPAEGSSFIRSTYRNVQSVEVSGPHSVTVKFSAPDAIFLQMMSVTPGAIIEKAFAEDAGTSFGSPQGGIMCAGAFMIEEWKAGTSITLVPNPHYWKPDAAPLADEVELRFISDATALVQAIKSGAIDGTWGVPPTQVAGLQSSSPGSVFFGTSARMYQIYTIAPGPMEDPNLRQALSLVIDRDAIAKSVFKGTGRANTSIVPETLWPAGKAESIWTEANEQLPVKSTPNLEAAKALVEASDYDGRDLVLVSIAGLREMKDMSTYIQQQAGKVGINIKIQEIQPAANASVFRDPTARVGMDMVMNSGALNELSPLNYPRMAVAADGPYNLVHYSSSAVDSLIADSTLRATEVEQAEAATEAQAIYMADIPVIPLVNPYEILYLRDGLTGTVPSNVYLFRPSLASIGTSD